ncbi:MAG: hypothetical protein QGE95_16530, partial [Arenicellales bacterium]|nr:hypothetical protein [Arenicellales bacterium]
MRSGVFLEASECTESGWNLPRDIYVTHDEEDHIAKGVKATEAAGSVLDDLDDAVETFRDGVGKARLYKRDDVFGVFAERPDEAFDRIKTASHGRRGPALEESPGRPRGLVVPELLE